MRRACLALLLCACGRIGFSQLDAVTSDGSASDAALVVTIAADRMAGPPTMQSVADLPAGTIGLSLREALTIAGNHAGPDAIRFDPSVFPVAAPVAIQIDSPLVVAGDTTIVDGGGTGVLIAGGVAFAGDLIDVAGTSSTFANLALSGGSVGVHVQQMASATTLAALAIDGTSSDAIFFDQTMHAIASDCRVSNAGANASLHVAASNDVTIERATVALSSKQGVVIGILVETSSFVHIEDSLVDPGTAWMIELTDTTDSDVTGSIVDGGDTGIIVLGASARDTIFRDVALNGVDHGVYIDTTASQITVLNVTCYMCSAGTEISDNGTSDSVQNVLLSTTATDFVDPAGYDFHLVAGSTAIDQGVDVGQDMLPASPLRFLGAGPDNGAVESY